MTRRPDSPILSLPHIRLSGMWLLVLLGSLGFFSDANGQVNYGYAGADVSNTTHLSYNRARYYDPESGTYLSQDPAGSNAGLNNYAYCGDNPVNNTDALGLDPSSQLFYSSWYFWAGSDTDPENQGASQVPTWAGTQKQIYVGMINAYSDPMNYAPIVFGALGGEVLEGEGITGGTLRIGGADVTGLGSETLFRTMTVEDLQSLMSTNTLPASAETFTSPSLSYVQKYTAFGGVPVQFNLNPGTIDQLADIGVRDLSKDVLAQYPDMQWVGTVDNWTDTNAFFKGEKPVINIGLGSGDALDIFNNNIISFGAVDSDGTPINGWTFPNLTSDDNSGGVLSLGGGLTIGGVLINEAATLVGENLSDIKGATYDPTSKQIIFLGSNNVNATTSINMDYFYTAVQAVYGSAVPPYVSLDFPATPSTPWTDYGNGDQTWQTGETNGFTMRYNPLWANVDTTIDVPVIANWNGTNYSFTLHFQAYQLSTSVGGRPGMGLIYTGADNLPSGISLSNQSLFATGQTPPDFSLTATSQDGHWPVMLYNNSGHSLNVTGFAVIPARQHREYGGRVDGTRLGWVMYEADRVMKCLAVGSDNLTGAAYNSTNVNVPGYYNVGELDSSMNDPGGFSRMWFEPNQMTLQRYTDPNSGQATINFQTSTVALFTENYLEGIPSDPAAQAFVTQFQTNYDRFAALNFPVLDPTDPTETRVIQVPIFAMLKQAMQAVSLARFFHDNNIPLDQSWMSTYQLPATYTPKSVPTARNASGSLLIYGGVQIVTPNGYVASPGQGGAQGIGQAVVSTRPSVADPAHSSQDLKQQSWSATTPSQGTLNAVATSLTSSSQNGITNLTQHDLGFVSPGQLPLTFARYYQSSYTGSGNMGPGWRYPRYDLQFTSPSWYDQHHYMKDSGGSPIATDVNSDTRLRSGVVRVMDNETGSELDFQSSLTLAYSTDVHNNPVVTINGLATGDVPTFTTGAHHNGATLTQNTDANKYYVLTHPDGSWMEFDNNGNIIETMDRHGYSQSYSYDTLGRLSTITDSTTPTPQVITLAYDPTSGLLTSSTGPNSVGMTYHYTTGGLLSAAVNTKTSTTIAQYAYNASSQLVSVTDASGASVLSSTPDLKGRSTVRKNARGNSATWSYFQDGAGNHVTQSYDANSGLSYAEQDADSNGRVTAQRDALGNWTGYGYAGSGMAPTSIQPPTPSDLGTPTTRPAITIQRNDAGLPLTITDPAVPSAQSVQIQYTTANLPQHMSDPAGRTADFYYTGSKNLQKIRNYHNGQSLDTVFGYQSEFLTSAADPMNHTWNYGRDSQGRMTSVSDPMGVTVRYDYDSSGRLWHVYDPKLSSAVTYGYDDLNRVTSVATPSGTQTYAYDPLHQWVDSATTTTTDGQVTTVQYTRNNQTGDVTSSSTTYQNPPVAGGGTQTVTTNYSYSPYGYLQSVTPPGADPINYNVNPVGQVTGAAEANGPTISANHASNSVWTNVNSQTLTWSAAPNSPSTVSGYNYAEDKGTSLSVNTTSTSINWNNLADGQHTFRVRTEYSDGSWSSESVFNLLIDSTAPSISASVTPSPIPAAATTVSINALIADQLPISADNLITTAGAASQGTSVNGTFLGGNMDLFTSVNDTSGVYTRNPSVWTGSLDLSGISVYRNSGGTYATAATLVTPVDAVVADHAAPPVGSVLVFVDNNNVVYKANVAAVVDVAGDLAVAHLTWTGSTPTTLKVYRVLPSNYQTVLPGSFTSNFAVVAVNQFRQVFCQDAGSTPFSAGTFTHGAATESNRTPYTLNVVGGDSSYPLFEDINGDAVFLGANFSSTTAPSVADNIPAVNAAIASFSGDTYSLSTYTLSNYNLGTYSDIGGSPQFRWCISGDSSRNWSAYSPMTSTNGEWVGTFSKSGSSQNLSQILYYQVQAQDTAGNSALFNGYVNLSPLPPTVYADESYGTAPTTLILANDGNYYGICQGGGQQSMGTVYCYTPAGVLSVLHSFAGTDGLRPNALIQGTDGYLYGTCQGGGSSFSPTIYAQNGFSGNGSVFKLSLTGTFSVVCSFPGGTAGAFPFNLVKSTDGNFYGLCSGGNNHDAYNGADGMVYKITPAGTLSTLASFGDTNNPPTTLIQASDGNLYGETGNGIYVTGSGKGDYVQNSGSIFQLTLGGTLTTLFDFSELSSGAEPTSLLEASNGVLYGTTQYGGSHGLVFSITKDGYYQTLFTSVAPPPGSFNPWFYPNAPSSLTQGPNGILYGEDWANSGTLYTVPISGVVSTICWLQGYGASSGAYPAAPVVIASDGSLMGTSEGSIAALQGPGMDGTIYNVNPKIVPLFYSPYDTPNSALETTLVDFNGKPATIGTQPATVQYLFTGQPATFSVGVASGVSPYTYQWQFNGTNIAGATGSTYSISSVTSANYGSYQVVITDPDGSITSNAGVLSAPFVQITTQPTSGTIPAGGTASFNVAANASGPIAYQWQRFPAGGSSWTNLADGGSYAGSATTSLSVIPTATSMSGDQFRCLVSNSYGQSQTSNVATLTVPVLIIAQQPTSKTVNGGQSASFQIVASPATSLSYQWQREASGTNTWLNLTSGGNYSGVTAANTNVSTLVVSSTTIAMTGDQFRCVLTNSYGTVTSNAAALSVVPLTFTTQPQQTSVFNGQTATFSAVVSGTGPFTYQWQYNGVNIPGATGSSYSITSASSSNAGTYTVIATDSYGSVTSSGGVLTVNQAAPGGGGYALTSTLGLHRSCSSALYDGHETEAKDA